MTENYQVPGMPVADPTEPQAPRRPDPATEVKASMVDGELVPTLTRTDDPAESERLQRLVTAEPGNATGDGRLHFLSIRPDGSEVCGGDGRPWPCSGQEELLTRDAHLSGAPTVQPETITRDQAALLLGISRADLDDRLRNVE